MFNPRIESMVQNETCGCARLTIDTSKQEERLKPMVPAETVVVRVRRCNTHCADGPIVSSRLDQRSISFPANEGWEAGKPPPPLRNFRAEHDDVQP